MVKRLFAVGTGVAMLGATAMGALAADLSTSYPNDFVTDGTFNGFFVVGENAAAIDNLAMTDIATSMKYNKPGATSTTTVEGDAWLVGTSTKFLEMANNNASDSSIIGETINAINTFIGDDELSALEDGVWTTNENEYTYQQFLYFDDSTGATNIVKYGEDSQDDVTGDHFYVKNGNQIANYKVEFTSTAQSDVTDSSGTADTTGTYLDDFEDTTLTLFGNEYTVVQARRVASDPTESAKLVLMAGATSDTLLEGETKTYTIGENDYEVTLTYVDATNAKFVVNGETTNKLQDGETYVLADKTEIGVSDVLYQAYAGGIHSSSFYLGASKVELRDDNVTNAAGLAVARSSNDMKVGSEDIDGAAVIIVGTDDDATFSISTIEVNMTAQDDFWVAAGEKLSDSIAANDEEKEVLFANAWDIEYAGLSDETTHELKLKTSSSRRYKMSLGDGDGDMAELPIAYAEAQYNISFGEESQANSRGNDKRLMLREGDNIYKDDYFVLTSGVSSSGAAKSYLLQYKGSDNNGKTSPKIKFKNSANGETLEYSSTTVTTTGTVATIKIGGNSFIVQNASAQGSDDFQLDVDLNGGGSIATNKVNWVDTYGAEFLFNSNTTLEAGVSGATIGADNQSWVEVRMVTPNTDDYNDHVPSQLLLNITSTTGPEVRASLSNVTLLTPDGETEVTYGYTSMGAMLTFTSPSGDPNELTVEYPENQRLPQLYVTSGATSSTSTASGDLTAVEVVDATKLDSEVADMMAQNVIAVGGPCVNSVSAEMLGSPSDCTEGFSPGQARVKLFEHANGNMAMLVAGYSGADTRLAGQFLAHRASDLSGEEVVIEGTTWSDATVGAPVVAVEEVMEEVMEETTEAAVDTTEATE